MSTNCQVPLDKHQSSGQKLVAEIVDILENFVPLFDLVSETSNLIWSELNENEPAEVDGGGGAEE